MDIKRRHAKSLSDTTADSLDVDVGWLLHSKKGPSPRSKTTAPSKIDPNATPTRPQAEPTPPQSPTEAHQVQKRATSDSKVAQINGALDNSLVKDTQSNKNTSAASPQPSAAPPPQKHAPERTPQAPRSTNDENKTPPAKSPVSSAKPQSGRKASFFSSLSSKFSSNSPAPARSASYDVSSLNAPPGHRSPVVEFGNPFNKKDSKPEPQKEKKEEKVVITHTAPQPRRQSVLVQAGTETKLDHPGFLSSALRRLSSSNNVTMGKGAGVGAICPRRVMNVDQNRDRVRISEFDQNKLKRVAFCVDVEIAGYAVAADEQDDAATRANQLPVGQRQSLASLERQVDQKNKDTKYKEKGEGAALKNPQKATKEKEEHGEPKVDPEAKVEAEKPVAAPAAAEKSDEKTTSDEAEKQEDSLQIPGTRKKEKKKRSEAERKERRERKRRHAEANGLVPLELKREDDSSDSSPNSTPPGASTPNAKSGDQPTTDPLRIYKRCCQLRETTALQRVKEQVSKPAANLAESSGVVAILDLSGTRMPLQDITTLGDWLAVVPVRKLILDDCDLSDEALRIILSGLAGCKSAEQARHNRKLPRRGTGKSGQEQLGVIEKLSLKNNNNITNLGWKHIALFLHLSRSLRAIDLSGIPFPKRRTEPSPGDLSRATTASSSNTTTTTNSEGSTKSEDLGTLITKALSQRFGGDCLEELIISGCGLTTSNIGEIVDSAVKCKIRRLGLANISLTVDGMAHIVRYVRSGVCEGLDLGSNNLHGRVHMLAEAVSEDNKIFAMSLSDCDLDPEDVQLILTALTKVTNFKFIDLSRNHALFAEGSNAVSFFRKVLPKFQNLKRIHLCDVDLTSEHVIALAEIFPDCPSLCHISILDNPGLVNVMNSSQSAAQEEACAFLVALMTAVRASRTIIAIELEVPSVESTEVVKALASQVVAYSLRNMEHSAFSELSVSSSNVMPNKDAPEVLLHLVGHMEGYDENHDNDDPAPDEDYVIASTGIVKALGVCLGSQDHSSRNNSRNITPTASGAATPKQGPLRPGVHKKPKDVSADLCNSARKIRMRLRPALVREDRAGNTDNYRKLLMLDGTLQRMIQRFEDEYPETKVSQMLSPPTNGESKLGSSFADASVLSVSAESSQLSKIPSLDDYPDETSMEPKDPYAIKLSRTSSNTSLAAKALQNEEGRMHRFGQTLRRDILKPTGVDDYQHGTSVNDPPESDALAALRAKFDGVPGEEILRKVELDGPDSVIREIGINAEELRALQMEDPEAFEAFKKSQLAAQINAGMLSPSELKAEAPC